MEKMTEVVTKKIIQAWDTLQTLVPVTPIRNEQQYDQAVETLNELLDVVGDDEAHPLYDLLGRSTNCTNRLGMNPQAKRWKHHKWRFSVIPPFSLVL
jgi:hypothetical protein